MASLHCYLNLHLIKISIPRQLAWTRHHGGMRESLEKIDAPNRRLLPGHNARPILCAYATPPHHARYTPRIPVHGPWPRAPGDHTRLRLHQIQVRGFSWVEMWVEKSRNTQNLNTQNLMEIDHCVVLLDSAGLHGSVTGPDHLKVDQNIINMWLFSTEIRFSFESNDQNLHQF